MNKNKTNNLSLYAISNILSNIHNTETNDLFAWHTLVYVETTPFTFLLFTMFSKENTFQLIGKKIRRKIKYYSLTNNKRKVYRKIPKINIYT